MMTIQFLKIANVIEMNPCLLLDASMVSEASCFCMSDSSSSRDRAPNRVVVLRLGVRELLRTCLIYLDL